jgi:hypothetical protein
MPANGLLYTTPHPCACYLGAKLSGFCALGPASKEEHGQPEAEMKPRLERGPAYLQPSDHLSVTSPHSENWPTYRHDSARSGFTSSIVGSDLKRAWQTELGGRLSSLVIAADMVLLASVDTHTVHALDAATGIPVWSYTTGGRVDSPPTIFQGKALFGSADGWVYCLRVSDGELMWRYRAAPKEHQLVARGQLESVWPVHGSLLAQEDVVYCVAGRSMFLDGGMRLCRLDPETGRLLSEAVLDDRDPKTGESLQASIKEHNMPPALPDVLSSDGQYVYMRAQRFHLDGTRPEVIAPADPTDQKGKAAHLFCPTGFLDDSLFHRSYWVFGKTFMEGPGGWRDAGRNAPAGLILAFDESSVYGFARLPDYYKWTTPMEYHLFASEKEPAYALHPKKGTRTGIQFRWSERIPLQARTMLLADKTLFVAGPPDVLDEAQAFKYPDEPEVPAILRRQDAALEGKEGAFLWVASAPNGRKLAQYDLESLPVWDGMAAAGGRLFMAMADGRVVCWNGE